MPTPKLQLLSRTQYDTDGSTTVWNFNFSGGYILQDHVKAYYDTPAGVRTPVTVTPAMLIGAWQLQITPAIPAGNVLTIYRATPKDNPMVDFTDRGNVSEVALDTLARQAIFVAAEASDDTVTANSDVAVNAAFQAQSSASAAAASGASAVTQAANAIASAATATTKAAEAATSAAAVPALLVNQTGVRSINGGQLAGLRNKIINGKMDISQRGASFATAASGAYTLDRWVSSYSTTGVVTITQQADAPASNEFQNSLRIAVTTADTSIAASENLGIFQNIEGFNVRDLIGKTFTLSFWARSSKTGIHCVSFRNTGSDRSLVAEYTVNAANTWEFKTVAVTGGLPTAGTWNWTNGMGVSVGFSLACGSTFQTTPGAWQTGNFLATVNQVNCLDTVGNIFAITGVQLEVGDVATAFEHRPIPVELAMCQRYFWTGGYGWAGSCISATNGTVSGTFPVQMRSAPTFSTIAGAGTNALIRSGGATETINTVVNSNADKNGGWIYFGGGGYTASSPYTVIKDLFTASAEL